MENFIVQGIITQTSNKQSGKFKGGQPRKTVWLKADEKNSALLIEKGFTEYSTTDEETGEEIKFFMIKTAKEVKIYTDQSGVYTSTLNGVGDLPEEQDPKNKAINKENYNFTSSDKVVVLDIVQGSNDGNAFSRISSIFDPKGYVVRNEQINPFKDLA